jgi:hypothetical protein
LAPAIFDGSKVAEQFGELGHDIFGEFIFAGVHFEFGLGGSEVADFRGQKHEGQRQVPTVLAGFFRPVRSRRCDEERRVLDDELPATIQGQP